jgi:hypothetical protein
MTGAPPAAIVKAHLSLCDVCGLSHRHSIASMARCRLQLCGNTFLLPLAHRKVVVVRVGLRFARAIAKRHTPLVFFDYVFVMFLDSYFLLTPDRATIS